MKKYWIVIACDKNQTARKSGFKKGKTFKPHDTFEIAKAEAQRLAGQHKGIRFGVFAFQGSTTVVIDNPPEETVS